MGAIFLGGFFDHKFDAYFGGKKYSIQHLIRKGQKFPCPVHRPANTLKALQLSGEDFGQNDLWVSRSDIPLTTREIFKLVGEKLRVKEEAQSRGKKVPDLQWPSVNQV